MHKILVGELELMLTNERQILNMGGPWIADVSVGTDFVSNNCILDNFVHNKTFNLLFFVKFNKVSKYYWYFSINFYNIDTKTVFEFDRVFDMVHIGDFRTKNELEIYPAFHAQFKDTQQIFNLDQEEFHETSQL